MFAYERYKLWTYLTFDTFSVKKKHESESSW